MVDYKEHTQLYTFMIILFTILCTFLFIYLYCRAKLNYWKRCGVQQFTNMNLIFGNFKNGILFRTAPPFHLEELYREAPEDAPYIGFYIFHKPCLLLKDPKLVKHILFHDFDKFYDRYFAGSPQKDSVGLVNLFGLKNPIWKYVRSKTTPAFSRKKLKQMIQLMMETGRPMIKFMQNLPVNDCGVKVFDAQDLNYKYSADLIGNVALGTKTDSFKYPDSDYTRFLMKFFRGFKRMIALSTVYFAPKLVEIFGSIILFDSTFLQKVFQRALESREKSSNTRGDYIDSIIKLKNEEQNPLWKFEGDNLFYQSGLFFSGFESSTITVIYVLMELARSKEYQDHARTEINEAINKHGWTFKAFNEMKFLDLCYAEGVRLYPPVAHLDRYTCEDYKLPGTDIIIEKGTPIYISTYGMHVDPKNFDEPLAFVPERFSGNKKLSDAYIPFGGGPRMCIGAEIGRLHMKVVLSMILSEFEIYRNPEEMLYLDSRSIFTAAANEIKIEFKQLIK